MSRFVDRRKSIRVSPNKEKNNIEIPLTKFSFKNSNTNKSNKSYVNFTSISSTLDNNNQNSFNIVKDVLVNKLKILDSIQVPIINQIPSDHLGDIVLDQTTGKFYGFDGTTWVPLAPTLAEVLAQGNDAANLSILNVKNIDATHLITNNISLTTNGSLNLNNNDLVNVSYISSSILSTNSLSGNLDLNGNNLFANELSASYLVGGDWLGNPINIVYGGTGVTLWTPNSILWVPTSTIVGLPPSGTNKILLGNSWSTSLPTTAQANITQTGTITSGVWNGTPILVNYGGAGTTLWVANALIYASSSTSLSQISTPGTNQLFYAGTSTFGWISSTLPSQIQDNITFLGVLTSTLNVGGNNIITDNLKVTLFSGNLISVESISSTITTNVENTIITNANITGTLAWTTKMLRNATGKAVTTNNLGEMFIAGDYSNTVLQIYDAANNLMVTFSNSSNGAFLVKYDTAGNYIFGTQIDGTMDALVANTPGDIVISGKISSTPFAKIYEPGGKIPLAYILNTFDEPRYLARYNSSGFYQWATKINNIVGTTAIDLNDSGNIIVCGSFMSTPLEIYDVAGSRLITTLPSTFTFCGFLLKYNVTGEYSWGTRFVAPENNFAQADAVTSGGDIFVAGRYTNTLQIYQSNNRFAVTLPNSNLGAFLVKYDTYGNYIWATRVTGSSTIDMTANDSGNVYLTGYTNTLVSIYSQGGTVLVTTINVTGNDAFIAKYSSSGVGQWITKLSNVSTVKIATNNLDAVDLTGIYTGTLIIYDTTSVVSPISSLSGGNSFLVRYNGLGRYQWATQFSGSTNQIVANNYNGDILIGGGYTNAFYTNGVTFQDSGNNSFLVKFIDKKFSGTLPNATLDGQVKTIFTTGPQALIGSPSITFAINSTKNSQKLLWDTINVKWNINYNTLSEFPAGFNNTGSFLNGLFFNGQNIYNSALEGYFPVSLTDTSGFFGLASGEGSVVVYYTNVSKIVFFTMFMTWNSYNTAGTNPLRVILPFQISPYWSHATGYIGYMTSVPYTQQIILKGDPGDWYLYLYYLTPGGTPVPITRTFLLSAGTVYISGMYLAAK